MRDRLPDPLVLPLFSFFRCFSVFCRRHQPRFHDIGMCAVTVSGRVELLGGCVVLSRLTTALRTSSGKDTEPGFSALDHDGRVVRVDTFSKCLAPGLRLGWITAPAATLAPLKAALIAATVGPSGQSVMAAHALTSTWGLSGFDAHLRALQARYRASARVLHAALGEHCAGLAEWAAPEAGMFVWLRVTCCEDVETDIMDELIAHKVRTLCSVSGARSVLLRSCRGLCAGARGGGCSPYGRIALSVPWHVRWAARTEEGSLCRW